MAEIKILSNCKIRLNTFETYYSSSFDWLLDCVVNESTDLEERI